MPVSKWRDRLLVLGYALAVLTVAATFIVLVIVFVQ
jgi:hypothetical protein